MQQGPCPPPSRFPHRKPEWWAFTATAEAGVIKLVWAMWKRHRALNALTGDNMSAMQIDHMGVLRLLGMPAALRHHGELCHLVNERGETGKSGEVNEWYYSVCFCCTPEAEGAERETWGLKLHGA